MQSVVGMTRTIGAPLPQRVDKNSYSFLSWSDGGVQTHDIRTPVVNSTYTAFYQRHDRR